MQEEEGNIEKFFKKRLEEQHFEFEESQWASLEKQLDADGQSESNNKPNDKGHNRTYWLLIITALLSFLLGWYLNGALTTDHDAQLITAKNGNETTHSDGAFIAEKNTTIHSSEKQTKQSQESDQQQNATRPYAEKNSTEYSVYPDESSNKTNQETVGKYTISDNPLNNSFDDKESISQKGSINVSKSPSKNQIASSDKSITHLPSEGDKKPSIYRQKPFNDTSIAYDNTTSNTRSHKVNASKETFERRGSKATNKNSGTSNKVKNNSPAIGQSTNPKPIEDYKAGVSSTDYESNIDSGFNSDHKKKQSVDGTNQNEKNAIKATHKVANKQEDISNEPSEAKQVTGSFKTDNTNAGIKTNSPSSQSTKAKDGREDDSATYFERTTPLALTDADKTALIKTSNNTTKYAQQDKGDHYKTSPHNRLSTVDDEPVETNTGNFYNDHAQQESADTDQRQRNLDKGLQVNNKDIFNDKPSAEKIGKHTDAHDQSALTPEPLVEDEAIAEEKHEVDSTLQNSVNEDQASKGYSGMVLGVYVAPDFSGTSIENLHESIGQSFGIEAGFLFSPKAVISVGVGLINKVYSAQGDEYSPRSGSWYRGIVPDNTDAECLALDIPISLGYRIINNGQRALWANLGISAYWLLTETYVFEFEPSSPGLPSGWEGRRENFHLLGSANFSLLFEQRLKARWSLTVSPYFRAPITGFGQGSIDLFGSGVNVGVRYKIPPRKPPE